MSNDQPTYSDETLTGRTLDTFRGLGRATVAARIEDPNGFEWVQRLRHDYLPENAEVKSKLVLAVMRTNAAALAAWCSIILRMRRYSSQI